MARRGGRRGKRRGGRGGRGGGRSGYGNGGSRGGVSSAASTSSGGASGSLPGASSVGYLHKKFKRLVEVNGEEGTKAAENSDPSSGLSNGTGSGGGVAGPGGPLRLRRQSGGSGLPTTREPGVVKHCDRCGLRFKTKASLQKHRLMTHHIKDEDMLDIPAFLRRPTITVLPHMSHANTASGTSSANPTTSSASNSTTTGAAAPAPTPTPASSTSSSSDESKEQKKTIYKPKFRVKNYEEFDCEPAPPPPPPPPKAASPLPPPLPVLKEASVSPPPPSEMASSSMSMSSPFNLVSTGKDENMDVSVAVASAIAAVDADVDESAGDDDLPFDLSAKSKSIEDCIFSKGLGSLGSSVRRHTIPSSDLGGRQFLGERTEPYEPVIASNSAMGPVNLARSTKQWSPPVQILPLAPHQQPRHPHQPPPQHQMSGPGAPPAHADFHQRHHLGPNSSSMPPGQQQQQRYPPQVQAQTQQRSRQPPPSQYPHFQPVSLPYQPQPPNQLPPSSVSTSASSKSGSISAGTPRPPPVTNAGNVRQPVAARGGGVVGVMPFLVNSPSPTSFPGQPGIMSMGPVPMQPHKNGSNVPSTNTAYSLQCVYPPPGVPHHGHPGGPPTGQNPYILPKAPDNRRGSPSLMPHGQGHGNPAAAVPATSAPGQGQGHWKPSLRIDIPKSASSSFQSSALGLGSPGTTGPSSSSVAKTLRSPEAITQHITKIISENEAIVETLNPLWSSKRYLRQEAASKAAAAAAAASATISVSPSLSSSSPSSSNSAQSPGGKFSVSKILAFDNGRKHVMSSTTSGQAKITNVATTTAAASIVSNVGYSKDALVRSNSIDNSDFCKGKKTCGKCEAIFYNTDAYEFHVRGCAGPLTLGMGVGLMDLSAKKPVSGIPSQQPSPSVANQQHPKQLQGATITTAKKRKLDEFEPASPSHGQTSGPPLQMPPSSAPPPHPAGAPNPATTPGMHMFGSQVKINDGSESKTVVHVGTKLTTTTTNASQGSKPGSVSTASSSSPSGAGAAPVPVVVTIAKSALNAGGTVTQQPSAPAGNQSASPSSASSAAEREAHQQGMSLNRGPPGIGEGALYRLELPNLNAKYPYFLGPQFLNPGLPTLQSVIEAAVVTPPLGPAANIPSTSTAVSAGAHMVPSPVKSSSDAPKTPAKPGIEAITPPNSPPPAVSASHTNTSSSSSSSFPQNANCQSGKKRALDPTSDPHDDPSKKPRRPTTLAIPSPPPSSTATPSATSSCPPGSSNCSPVVPSGKQRCPSLLSPETPRPRRSYGQLFLNGHAYTYLRLRAKTQVTYCSLFNLQPTYVPVSSTEEPHLSMYSIWQVVPPTTPDGLGLGLTPSESMSLYDSGCNRHCSDRFPPPPSSESGFSPSCYTVAGRASRIGKDARVEATSTIVTASSYWLNRSKEEKKESVNVKRERKGSESDGEKKPVLHEVKKEAPDGEDVKPSVKPNKLSTSKEKRRKRRRRRRRLLMLMARENGLKTGGSDLPTSSSANPISTSSRVPMDTSAAALATSGRIKIFEGGYKSLDDYEYVRGRGRGRYICGECGIRCKKPSMLKKHLRIHTNLRPYACKYCNFSFKTKGNLTKHSKSKAHLKKKEDVLAKRAGNAEADKKENSTGPDGVNGIAATKEPSTDDEEDTSSVPGDMELDANEEEEDMDEDDDDEDGEEDDDDELDEEEDDEDDDDLDDEDDEEGDEDAGEDSSGDEEGRKLVKEEDFSFISPSKRDAVGGLLCLSSSRVSSRLADENPPKTSGYVPTAVSGAITTLSAQKEMEHLSDISSRFLAERKVPPVDSTPLALPPLGSPPVLCSSSFPPPASLTVVTPGPPAPPLDEAAPSVERCPDDKKSENPASTLSSQSFVPTDEETGGPGADSEDVEESMDEDDDVEGREDEEELIGRVRTSSTSHGMPVAPILPGYKQSNGVNSVPTFGRVNGDEERSVCGICGKAFSKPSQLKIHVNIHYFERPYRCEACAVSFRTRGHLQKHKKSVSHFNKLNMNLAFGAPTTDNPRPFKCSDCNVAFRIHGHLAKHLRSKLHIMKLECVGKLPFGTYAEMERAGVSLNDIDTSDCDNSLDSLIRVAVKLNLDTTASGNVAKPFRESDGEGVEEDDENVGVGPAPKYEDISDTEVA